MKRSLDAYTDIHTHDRSRDGAPGVIVCLQPGDEVPPRGAYSVGIHPWATERPVTLTTLKQLVRAASLPNVVAIGECGFDKSRGGDAATQRAVFDLHARLAERLGKPLIIHSVHSAPELIDAIRRHRPSVEWIIHGFRGNPILAAQLVKAGFSLSLGKKFNPGVPAAVPADRLYKETD